MTLQGRLIDCAIRVHSRLGPGVLENSHEACLAHDLEKAGLKVLCQVGLPLVYEGVHLEVGYRWDLLVENEVVVEVLINFHELLLKNGIIRMVNNYQELSASSQLARAASALKRFENTPG